MDPSALIDTLSPNDMDMWNGYNFFSDENLTASIKDDIKEENLDMDCCFSSICPNDLINSLETNLKSHFHEQNFDYNSSASVSPEDHAQPFDFVPCVLQEPVGLSSSSLLSIGLDNQAVKYDLETVSCSPSSASSSALSSPAQNSVEQKTPGQLYHIQHVQNLAKPSDPIGMDKSKNKSALLPPSPPSSLGSDSESNQSCQSVYKSEAQSSAHAPKSKNTLKSSFLKQTKNQSYHSKSAGRCKSSTAGSKSSLNNLDDDCWPFFVSLSKLPSSGPILLTEEEKRTLVQEGHQVPTQLPLTKSEEKILKKIRRKIKNKISAQESRRKKKEYVDSLERKMESYISENVELKKRLDALELNNKTLLLQLEKMKCNLSNGDASSQSLQTFSQTITDLNQSQTNSNQFGTLILVLVLFFTVVFGIWSPIITKDQLTNSAACSTAPVATGLSRSQASSSSVAVVAVATAAAAATASLKADDQAEEPKQSMRQIIYEEAVPSLKRKMLSDEDELNGHGNVTNSIARSKTGTTVELTKVRPFIGKMPTIAKNAAIISKMPVQTNQTAPQSDYFVVNQTNEDGQVIILNLANSQTAEIPKQMNNIRVINSAPNVAKMPTRFRVINNTSNYNSLNQAVIKLSSS
ncbi:cyclic AMP-responsive element-binding 3 1 isoform X1 [Brachionus plicatilis]|uniref:Cyclic AMP-responsive element-binding 3 1 isoform X1 n=1 Tax=Brachionus plicatilis TaxID=10195 RepID=A0A3M7RZH3_BRAPC|nr:cyclic AMP-responsive element-binding 3 1 isoform X1 [Brachionus plicatilis]